MSCPFTQEELEDHAAELLQESRAREVDAHVARCRKCRDELDWLRLERHSFEERRASAEDSTAALWSGIEERIGTANGRESKSTGGVGTVVRLGRGQRAAWFGSGFAAATGVAPVASPYSLTFWAIRRA